MALKLHACPANTGNKRRQNVARSRSQQGAVAENGERRRNTNDIAGHNPLSELPGVMPPACNLTARYPGDWICNQR